MGTEIVVPTMDDPKHTLNLGLENTKQAGACPQSCRKCCGLCQEPGNSNDIHNFL